MGAPENVINNTFRDIYSKIEESFTRIEQVNLIFKERIEELEKRIDSLEEDRIVY